MAQATQIRLFCYALTARYFEQLMDPNARCLACYYLLRDLGEARCPECGRPFDPKNPRTFTTRPPFVRWKFWLPSLLLSIAGGLLIWIVLFASAGVGVASTIVVPFSIGSVIGYTCRVRTFTKVILALSA